MTARANFCPGTLRLDKRQCRGKFHLEDIIQAFSVNENIQMRLVGCKEADKNATVESFRVSSIEGTLARISSLVVCA